jgi:hypothetical protein
MSSIYSVKVSFAGASAIFLVFSCISSGAQMTSVGIDCSQIEVLGIDRQTNLRAARVMSECGSNYDSAADTYDLGWAGTEPLEPLGIKNVLVSTAKCTTSTNCERNTSVVWASSEDGGKTLVDNYNDLSSNGSSSGTSYSKNGGAKFVEIQPAPFGNGHGTNYGDPIEVFNATLRMWFAGDLTSDCGGLGVGLWTSTDGIHWETGACAHNGASDDRPSMWVDNEPTSGTYGRMYVSFNDFSNNAALTVVHSDDGKVWSAPVVLSGTTLIRDVQLTGSPVGARRYEGSNSTVFVMGMDEGGGGLATRQNIIFKSLDGGTTWSSTTTGPRFNPPGNQTCPQNSYYVVIPPIWRTQGWGQPAVGAKGVVHYAYAGAGTKGDIADIFYVRSTDNGRTWSKAIKLNTDADNPYHTQWIPSLTADKDGKVTVAWYDRRAAKSKCAKVGDPGCNYERVGRQSKNNGVSFGSEITISSIIIPQPTGISCFAGDYNYDTTLNGKVYDGWTDGRVTFQGENVQNVEFAIPVGK